jgi:hypothetical protein
MTVLRVAGEPNVADDWRASAAGEAAYSSFAPCWTHDAHRVERNIEPGGWAVEARLREWPWEIIFEPDVAARRIVVITACPLD